MPTVLREAGFRFHFFSADGGELVEPLDRGEETRR
jgi:hypothetical protein